MFIYIWIQFIWCEFNCIAEFHIIGSFSEYLFIAYKQHQAKGPLPGIIIDWPLNEVNPVLFSQTRAYCPELSKVRWNPPSRKTHALIFYLSGYHRSQLWDTYPKKQNIERESVTLDLKYKWASFSLNLCRWLMILRAKRKSPTKNN